MYLYLPIFLEDGLRVLVPLQEHRAWRVSNAEIGRDETPGVAFRWAPSFDCPSQLHAQWGSVFQAEEMAGGWLAVEVQLPENFNFADLAMPAPLSQCRAPEVPDPSLLSFDFEAVITRHDWQESNTLSSWFHASDGKHGYHLPNGSRVGTLADGRFSVADMSGDRCSCFPYPRVGHKVRGRLDEDSHRLGGLPKASCWWVF